MQKLWMASKTGALVIFAIAGIAFCVLIAPRSGDRKCPMLIESLRAGQIVNYCAVKLSE